MPEARNPQRTRARIDRRNVGVAVTDEAVPESVVLDATRVINTDNPTRCVRVSVINPGKNSPPIGVQTHLFVAAHILDDAVHLGLLRGHEAAPVAHGIPNGFHGEPNTTNRLPLLDVHRGVLACASLGEQAIFRGARDRVGPRTRDGFNYLPTRPRLLFSSDQVPQGVHLIDTFRDAVRVDILEDCLII